MAKKETSSVYEIIQGLSQASANAYDGALTEDGEPIKVGLRREEGNVLLDQRIIDGFNVVFYGDMMCLTYESDVQLKEVHAAGFESEIDQRLSEITKWLKKEYRKVTGKSVTLTEEGEIDVMVQNISNMRTWLQAKKHYKVGGLSEEMRIEAESKSTLDKSWKTFLDQGGWKGKRPKNDTRPKNTGE
tara:strand:+ start:1357 stop:1917 length:561 start_codon:yes stop_codon:yes gene_type:complete